MGLSQKGMKQTTLSQTPKAEFTNTNNNTNSVNSDSPIAEPDEPLNLSQASDPLQPCETTSCRISNLAVSTGTAFLPLDAGRSCGQKHPNAKLHACEVFYRVPA